MSRREFMKTAALGGAGLALWGCKPEPDAPTAPVDSEAIVVGSGFGGAVSALRLGLKGVQTTVLERGRRWELSPNYDTFTHGINFDKRTMWLRDRVVLPFIPQGINFDIERYTGLLDVVEFSNMKVYSGAGVGGGSLVYGGMTVMPRAQEFNEIFGDLAAYSEMVPYYQRVQRMLNAVPFDQNPYFQAFKDSGYWEFTFRCAEDVETTRSVNPTLRYQYIPQAYQWDVIYKELIGEIPKSALIGELIFGNNSGAKNSLDLTYLRQAEATGKVVVHPFHKVESIGRDAEKRYTLDVSIINDRGEVVDTRTLRCKYLFLGAGSMGTSRLLLKAKREGTLKDLNDEVGKGWGSNGNGMFMRQSLPKPTGEKQATPPVIAVTDFDNPYGPVIAECAQYPLGFECNCLLYLGLGVHTKRGEYRYEPGAANDGLVLDWPDDGNEESRQGIRHMGRQLNDAAGGSFDTDKFPDEVSKEFTYHPLGGAVMGKATDKYGRVKNYDRLYVTDGAAIPGNTACSNPSWTIAAIAERNLERILAEDF